MEKYEQLQKRMVSHASLPKKEHTCPKCGINTSKVHDDLIQKVKHLA